ncbi:MAG: Ig-like domain-containing protein [Alistipes sp.]|nr:Ig-like domain-containing protein [Alistipes sp.]MBQ8367415.1 Ig-like domain-containing protein [Alistipes sp.]
MKNYLLLAVAAVALAFTACKKDDPGADTPQVVAVTGVSLNTSAVALEVDDSVTLTATVAPANATNKGVEWSVADDAIATVKNGVVTAVAIGETTVTATTVDGGFTATATITVAESIVEVTGVTLDKPGLELEIGDSETLTATITPADATNKGVSWSTANDAIATVVEGVVTAVAAGETTVTVTTADGGFTATANVVVKAAPIKVDGVSLDKTMVALEIGESLKLNATVTPANADDKSVTWSVGNDSIATVKDGTVTGVAVGETNVTVTTTDGGFTATIPVKVVTEKVAVTGIEWYGAISRKELRVGQEERYCMIISPEEATDMGVVWTSSDPEVATVEHYRTELNGLVHGMLTAIKPGKVTITCTTNDGGFTATTDEITILAQELVTSIDVSPNIVKVEVNETLKLDVSVYPTNAHNRGYEAISSDPSIATIDKNNVVTGVSLGQTEITFKAIDGSGVETKVPIWVLGPKPTQIKFGDYVPNSSLVYEAYSWQGKQIDVKNDVNMTVNPADADLRWFDWEILYDNNPEALKYEVTKDNIIASVAYTENYSGGHYYIQILPYLNGNLVGDARIYLRTYPYLFESYGYSDNTTLTPVDSMDGTKNYSYNWNSTLHKDGLNVIFYYYNIATWVDRFKEYQIPATQYTLTSSDESKVKVTKLTTGEGYRLERLVWDELVAVKLTYKCGEHTQTYTLNLIP